MNPRRIGATLASAALLAMPLTAFSTGSAEATTHFRNCTALHKHYAHGVGKKGAKDHHSASSKAVTNFKVSTTIYQANKNLDRDKDGIACEKH